MHHARLIASVIFCAASLVATAVEKPVVTLAGEVGHAASSCAARFHFAPFDSVSWLRADLTGEKCTEHDEAPWGHVMKRPFKNYSGDISGRFIEVMAMNAGTGRNSHPAFKTLLDELARLQRPGGYFCASGTIDWEAPIDHPKEGDDPLGSRMLPALWGNARLLCGLVESMRAFPEDQVIADTARRLGDFYLTVLPRFNDPERIDEYTAGGTYAAGYVTCWFPAMEGLVKLGNLTGERKYIDAAAKMAAFHQRFDQLPVDHAHGMLCNHVGLLLLYEATRDEAYLSRVENRWDELVQGGYINPAGGILEKCRVKFVRDEGCGLVDWMRLNLELAHITGNARYWAMAERTLHNHFLQNQGTKGGYGHRKMHCDDHGVHGFGKDNEESTWCCTFHGELGWIETRRHLVSRNADNLSVSMALDFKATDSTGLTISVLRDGLQAGEVLRQRIALSDQPATVIRVRHPHWAESIDAVDPMGKPIPLNHHGHWSATARPVDEVEFIYSGDVYVENRRCERLPEGPLADSPFVLFYGPKLLVHVTNPTPVPAWPADLQSLKNQGWMPIGPEHRTKELGFVPNQNP